MMGLDNLYYKMILHGTMAWLLLTLNGRQALIKLLAYLPLMEMVLLMIHLGLKPKLLK